jgi:transcriptional regulator with XRE-family HTH domain
VDATSIGERIAVLRQRRGWSQAELAKGLGLSHSYVSLIESGRRLPRHRVLARLAATLECSVDYLVHGHPDSQVQALDLDLRFAELALRSGDPCSARDRYAQVLAGARKLDDHGDLARGEALRALWGLSRAEEAVGHLEAAIEGYEELLAAPDLPMTVSRLAVATALCRSYRQCGDLTRAVDVAETALRGIGPGGVAYRRGDSRRCDPLAYSHHLDPLANSLADPLMREEAHELGSILVLCYCERGDLTRAHLLARRIVEGLDRPDGWASPCVRGAAYRTAALVAEARGELDSALTFAERALALYSESETTRAGAVLRLTNAWVLLQQPRPRHPEALELLRRAHADFLAVGTPVDLANTETELARCELLAGDSHSAAQMASMALGRLADEHALERARARAVLADAQLAMGEDDAAVQTYAQATGELERAGASRQAAAVWRELADAMVAAGRGAEAVTAYRRATDALGVRGRPGPAARSLTTVGAGAP